MTRYWISWVQGTEDSRPLTWPLPENVPKYWRTGEAPRGPTLCAIVDTDDDPKAIVERLWGAEDIVEWRFCNTVEVDWKPEPTRFPWGDS